MTRGEYTDKIWRSVNYSQHEVRRDPDYLMIDEALRRIPPSKLQEFYDFLMENDAYHDRNGQPRRNGIHKAATDYLARLSERLWARYGLEEKVKTLLDKACAVAGSLRLKELKHPHLDERLDEVQKNIDRFGVIDKASGTRHPLLTQEERRILQPAGGIRELLLRCIDPDIDDHERREWLRELYRREFVYRELFGEEGAEAMQTVAIPRPSGGSNGLTDEAPAKLARMVDKGVQRF